MHGSRAIPWPRAEQLFEVSARNGKLMVPVVHPSPFLNPVGLYRRRTGGTILLCTGICGEPSLRDKINTVARFFFACPIFLRYIVPPCFSFFFFFFLLSFLISCVFFLQFSSLFFFFFFRYFILHVSTSFSFSYFSSLHFLCFS